MTTWPNREQRTVDATRMSLRPATGADKWRVWQWNNHPQVRAVSHSTDPISWRDHEAWFERQLVDTDSTLYIVLVDRVPAGIVRLARERARGAALLSITIAPAYRGQGVGVSALRAACDHHAVAYPSVPVEAWVECTNLASTRCFLGAGFREHAIEERAGRRFNVYRWHAEAARPTPRADWTPRLVQGGKHDDR
jgi:RimJ/RimL family protein N-acetyltransferase